MNQISGLFLSFTPEEGELLKRRIEVRGYEWSASGVKKFLFDKLTIDSKERAPDHADRVIDRFKNYLTENPDRIVKGLETAERVFRGVDAAIRKGRR